MKFAIISGSQLKTYTYLNKYKTWDDGVTALRVVAYSHFSNHVVRLYCLKLSRLKRKEIARCENRVLRSPLGMHTKTPAPL